MTTTQRWNITVEYRVNAATKDEANQAIYDHVVGISNAFDDQFHLTIEKNEDVEGAAWVAFVEYTTVPMLRSAALTLALKETWIPPELGIRWKLTEQGTADEVGADDVYLFKSVDDE